MIFSSFVFVFLFLPITIGIYFVVKNRKFRNFWLCLVSLLFYAWGEPVYVFLMLFSILINYFLVILLDKHQNYKKIFFLLSLGINLFVLGFFKYGNFFIENINSLLGLNIGLLNVTLPVGISFYTFQILSYVIDVYRGKVKVQKNLLNLATYISLFPQLVAGPIVRYETIQDELENRKESFDLFSSGIKRFIIGFAKKIVIANNMALIADTIFNGDIASTSTSILWLGAICYTFQIYFDFSGYSDMAIGLGKVFGFNFLENFNYPYISKSITDFWRRWHMSLSSWFRDYVYIPLGGNRCSKWKWFRNITIVWLLTGFWHGASWNFILWGLYYGIILILEKLFLLKWLKKVPPFLAHLYALLFIIIGWVIFRSPDLESILLTLKGMFIYKPGDIFGYLLNNFDVLSSLPYLLFAIIGCVPLFKSLYDKYESRVVGNIIISVYLLLIFGFSICLLMSSTYNPFIYFRF